MYIAWRPQMSVDNGVIDEDHRTLIEIINAFIGLKYDREMCKFKQVLMNLDEYAKFHFEREETLQKTIRYQFIDAHSHEHKDLIRQLDRMRVIFDKHATPEEVSAAHERVCSLLRGWLIDHIIQSDLRMREAFVCYVQEQKQTPKRFFWPQTAMTVSRPASYHKARPRQQ